MNQPFSRIKKENMEREVAERKRREAEQREKDEAEELRQAKLRSAAQYDEMVMRVLGLLRDAAYRSYKVQRRDEGQYANDRNFNWRIALPNWDGDTIEVTVQLIFDHLDQPSHLLCNRHGYYVKKRRWWRGEIEERYPSIECGLVETELIEALERLHPVGQ